MADIEARSGPCAPCAEIVNTGRPPSPPPPPLPFHNPPVAQVVPAAPLGQRGLESQIKRVTYRVRDIACSMEIRRPIAF